MNKGEWSEFYSFLRVLADGVLYAADDNLNKTELFYPVRHVIRETQSLGLVKYYVSPDSGVVKFNLPNSLEKTVTQSLLDSSSTLLFSKIRQSVGSFLVPEIDFLISELGTPKLKEESRSKRDITIVVYDTNVAREQELGFSIKSRLGGASTLFNAGKSTNFTFKISGYDRLSSEQKALSLTLKAKELVRYLSGLGCELKYYQVDSPNFLSNLRIVDSRMDEIMAFYLSQYFKDESSRVSELVAHAESADPCQYHAPNNQRFYEHKTKQFLLACALGMTAQAAWNGEYNASGGYIVVKEDGSLVCYHIYNWNSFQSYLLANTFLDTASTSRHGFGELYFDGDTALVKLNLQIRFS